jgi:hypothetical protein
MTGPLFKNIVRLWRASVEKKGGSYSWMELLAGTSRIARSNPAPTGEDVTKLAQNYGVYYR